MVHQLKKYSYVILALAMFGCNNDPKTVNTDETKEVVSTEQKSRTIPQFNEQNAYDYIQKQVDFGPRVPGSKEHFNTFEFLRNELLKHCDTVMVQSGGATTFDQVQIPIYNIIGSFNPEASKRVLLCAHWDTRPFADEDDSASTAPILGANDGGSGVGILLELAQMIKSNPLDYGIDIIFFDAEDWGKGSVENSFCLGSQFWGKNTHVPNYQADYGILLDMVGSKGAQFAIEGFSQQTAPYVVKKVWSAAAELGHSNLFTNYNRGYVTDDHFYANQATGIPMIDIINYNPSSAQAFGEYWHTHDDNMDVIDKNILKAVGQTLTILLYRE